jgi:hypothetical protein
MGSLIGFLATTFVGEKYARPAAYALVIGLFLAICGVARCTYDHSVVAKYEAKQQQRAAPATNKATEQRAKDAETRAAKSQEMSDVIHSVPDQAINPVSHARGCEQLRRAGKRVAACSGSSPAR